MDPFLAEIPVWLVITPLIGVVNGALFFLVVGRRPSSLPLYLALSVIAASAVQALGPVEAGSPPFSLGDVQLVAASLGAWVTLVVTRVVGR
ncbi:MAG: hypothetical protein IT305_21210 [Chloroflexi bacterium]|nr:hypothetical protein [Chloroflexota bacterium]